MRLSIALGVFTGYPLSLRFAIAARSGADGVEVLLSDRLIRNGADSLRKLIERHHLPVLSVHQPLRWRPRQRSNLLPT